MTTASVARWVQASADRIKAGGRFVPLGGRTKPALWMARGPSSGSPTNEGNEAAAEQLDVSEHRGVEFYDPSEFLLTAKAGTPLVELINVLSDKGQYLPFDPLFTSAVDGHAAKESAPASTLGGTVASGLSGSNSLLYGRLRDFMLEVELIDGLGEVVRGGGKVVKNAAGFDLPKLMVGSYGRLGVLTEVTLKVFPAPFDHATLPLQCGSLLDCFRLSQQLLRQPLPIEAIDFLASGEYWVRLAGPSDSLPGVARRARDSILGQGLGEVAELITGDVERQLWHSRRQAIEAAVPLPSPGNDLAGEANYRIRVAVPGNRFEPFAQLLSRFRDSGDLANSGRVDFIGGGTTAWLQVSSPQALERLDEQLQRIGLSGIVLRGPVATLRPLGDRKWIELAERIRTAVDPHQRFLAYCQT